MLIRISRRVEEIHTHTECADMEGTQRSGSGHAPSQSLFWFCPSFPSDLRLGEEHSEYLQSSLSTGAQVSGAFCKIQCSHAFDSHPQVQTSFRIRCQSKLTQNPRPPGLAQVQSVITQPLSALSISAGTVELLWRSLVNSTLQKVQFIGTHGQPAYLWGEKWHQTKGKGPHTHAVRASFSQPDEEYDLACESPASKPGKLQAGIAGAFQPFTGSCYLHIIELHSHVHVSSSITRNFTADE